MKVIAVINQKGGVGKSTTTIELANIIAAKGKRVLLLDLDPQRNTTKYVGADFSKPSIYEVLHAEKHIRDAIQKCGRIDVIASSEDLSKADRQFIDHDDIYLLADIIGFVAEDYDYVFIDNAPARNVLLTMTYVATDYVIIPSEADDGAIDGVDAVNKDIFKYRQSKRPITQAKIAMVILNKLRTSNLNNETINLLEKKCAEYDDKPVLSIVRLSVAASECKFFKESVMDYAPNNNVTKDFQEAADKLLERIGE